jgi:hypothetical protein
MDLFSIGEEENAIGSFLKIKIGSSFFPEGRLNRQKGGQNVRFPLFSPVHIYYI